MRLGGPLNKFACQRHFPRQTNSILHASLHTIKTYWTRTFPYSITNISILIQGYNWEVTGTNRTNLAWILFWSEFFTTVLWSLFPVNTCKWERIHHQHHHYHQQQRQHQQNHHHTIWITSLRNLLSRFGRGTKRNSYRKTCNKIAKKQKRPRLEKYKTKERCYHYVYVLNIE